VRPTDRYIDRPPPRAYRERVKLVIEFLLVLGVIQAVVYWLLWW
jgi:hypothetical protein